MREVRSREVDTKEVHSHHWMLAAPSRLALVPPSWWMVAHNHMTGADIPLMARAGRRCELRGAQGQEQPARSVTHCLLQERQARTVMSLEKMTRKVNKPVWMEPRGLEEGPKRSC